MPLDSSTTVITVGLGDRSYPIAAGAGLLSQIGSMAREAGFHSPVPVITDDTVAPLYAETVRHSLEEAGYTAFVLSFPAGEPSKNLETMARLYDGLVERRVERKSGLVALGGGVVGDVAGFAAATYLRGIPFIQVPTTLLAQVDAAVGGKVGIDHAKGKNLIGAFYQPKAVVIDTRTLHTLPLRQLRAGLAEIIKHGVIRDEALFQKVGRSLTPLLTVDEALYQEIIPWNCRIKARVVEEDEKESGLRAILNFGHTVGHAIEALTGYNTYLHGEAVALGMLVEARLGQRLGLTPASVIDALHDLLQQAAFPLEKPDLPSDKLIEAMFLDKKVERGTLRFILPDAIGHVQIVPVDDVCALKEAWDH